MVERINPKITRQVFEEYRKLYLSNKANMLDANSVYTQAGRLELFALMNLVEEDVKSYFEIRSRYKFYSKKYKRKIT